MRSWLDERREDLLEGIVAPMDVDNINVPSCDEGSIRGTVVGIPLAEEAEGAFQPQDCTSTLTDPQDDVEGLNNGYITQSTVPLE